MASGTRLAALFLFGLIAIGVLASCGSTNSNENETASASSEAESELRDKLALCADEWNSDGAEWNSPSSRESDVLISTTPQGQCVVVFSEESGQLPAWVVERSPEGEWAPLIDSEVTDLQRRLKLATIFEDERLTAPNAKVVDQSQLEAVIEFDPDAPIPSSAVGGADLLANPATKKCGNVVSFSGGAIGDFYLTVEEAAGISCGEVAKIAGGFPFFVQEWSCSGGERMECGKGDVTFTLLRSKGSPSSGNTKDWSEKDLPPDPNLGADGEPNQPNSTFISCGFPPTTSPSTGIDSEGEIEYKTRPKSCFYSEDGSDNYLISLKGLKWTGWGNSQATASGFWQDTSDQDGDGEYALHRADVRVSDLKSVSDSSGAVRWYYRQMTVSGEDRTGSVTWSLFYPGRKAVVTP